VCDATEGLEEDLCVIPSIDRRDVCVILLRDQRELYVIPSRDRKNLYMILLSEHRELYVILPRNHRVTLPRIQPDLAMGNKVFKEKFKIRNDTKFPVYVNLSQGKCRLDIENIQPGKKGSLLRSLSDSIPGFAKYDRTVMRVLGDEQDEQKNFVVLDIQPEERGFFEVLPGRQRKSHKLWTKAQTVREEQHLYLTVLTRQFLIQGLNSRDGKKRIDNNPVGANTYNVAIYNEKQEGLHKMKRILITNSHCLGKLEVCYQ